MAASDSLRTIGTLARLAARGAFKTLSGTGQPAADGERFEAAFSSFLADPAVVSHIRTARVLTLEADESGWAETGIDIEPGEQITVMATGTLWASKLFDMRFGARLGIWLRAGDKGTISKTPGDVGTLNVTESGPLYLVAKPPGEWADEQGGFDPDFPRKGISGALEVCVIVWKGDAIDGLKALLQVGDYLNFVTRALDEAQKPVATPEGWHYLWRLGRGAIYRDTREAGDRHIHCHTKEDVGILQFPADFPLTDTTRLSWRWKVDKLPTDLPEDIQLTHDYLSIAVEFDNGQDLTYMWSGRLAEGTIFKCPLPFWDKVETHWVLRSNPNELGKWLPEERFVKVDYAKAIGAPPQRIVRVWLIAVSVFQRGEGICDYADIELVDGDKRLKVI